MSGSNQQPSGALKDWGGVSAPMMIPTPGPWKVALVTSVLGAATGWVLDEVAQVMRRKKRRR
jgi:hypothetical protein